MENVFLSRLRAEFPDRASRVEKLLREMRDGALSDPRFGHRMRGRGPYSDALMANFELERKRLGLTRVWRARKPRPRPRSPQLELFKSTRGSDSLAES